MLAQSQPIQRESFEKNALGFFYMMDCQTLEEGVQIASPGRGCNGCSIL